MKYYEVQFTLTPCTQDARDILSAMAGEAGFETFEETTDGLTGYVQQQLFDRTLLDSVIEGFPFGDTHIIYNVREAEDRDWNEQWEQEGFEPIVVEREQAGTPESTDALVIHDGRHQPATAAPLSIEIDAHMAFGTGTHETTRMICAILLDLLPVVTAHPSAQSSYTVLDCGCGTGILGICALKLGATHCTAYDIDEWSVDNTRHNAVINHVDRQLTPLHGDATLLDSLTERFDLVMANINRNILLQDLPRFVTKMRPGATLILSGFYKEDCAMLQKKAQELGLTLCNTRYDGPWACLTFCL